jgi:hypothetical protein
VPWLRWLLAGLSPRWPRFDPTAAHVRFVVNTVALREGFPPEYFAVHLSILFHQCPMISFMCMSMLPAGQMLFRKSRYAGWKSTYTFSNLNGKNRRFCPVTQRARANTNRLHVKSCLVLRNVLKCQSSHAFSNDRVSMLVLVKKNWRYGRTLESCKEHNVMPACARVQDVTQRGSTAWPPSVGCRTSVLFLESVQFRFWNQQTTPRGVHLMSFGIQLGILKVRVSGTRNIEQLPRIYGKNALMK